MQKMIRMMSGPGASRKMKKLQRKGGFPNLGGMGGFPGMF
jgi:hypothetical protein